MNEKTPVTGNPNYQGTSLPINQGVAAEAELIEFKARVHDALERTPLSLQEYIGERTFGIDGLFERVVLGCEGSRDKAILLIREEELATQLSDPKYDHDVVNRELENVTKRISEFGKETTEATI